MIDQIKPKSLGADLNNTKVTGDSNPKVAKTKVSILIYQKMSTLIMETFRSSFLKKR